MDSCCEVSCQMTRRLVKIRHTMQHYTLGVFGSPGPEDWPFSVLERRVVTLVVEDAKA